MTPLAYTVAAKMPSSQHLFTRAGAELIQLIYSGRTLRALSVAFGDFGVNSFFG